MEEGVANGQSIHVKDECPISLNTSTSVFQKK